MTQEELIELNKSMNALEKFIADLPEKALNLGIRVLIAAVILFIGFKLIKFIRKILKKSLTKASIELGVIQFLDSLLKVILNFILVLIVAGNFGFDATSIVALMGSAGVAVGLALQGSLSNIAGGILILLLKPFRVGDYIIEDSNGNEGTVKEIGIFFTKLQTGDNKIVILPNGALPNTFAHFWRLWAELMQSAFPAELVKTVHQSRSQYAKGLSFWAWSLTTVK